MRRQFFARALQRLSGTQQLLGKLRERPADKDLLDELRKDVHWLAGTGGTYKVPTLSEIGDEAELICDEALEDGEPLRDGDITQMEALIKQACTVIEREQEK